MTRKWRMETMCADCPFASKGAGLHLRKTLRPGRWKEILNALRKDGYFYCHKTTKETGDGSEMLCAGSLDWQEKHIGYPGQLARICERIYQR